MSPSTSQETRTFSKENYRRNGLAVIVDKLSTRTQPSKGEERLRLSPGRSCVSIPDAEEVEAEHFYGDLELFVTSGRVKCLS